jgi:hypothetical protein
MKTHEDARRRILAAVEALPDDAISDVEEFVEFQPYKRRRRHRPTEQPLYKPIALGGLWKGIKIADEDIAEVRREMWDGFGERGL